MVGTNVEFDTVLELCTDAHRRIVLAVLTGRQRPASFDDLVDAIVEHNHHETRGSVPTETTQRIEISLVHTHLPKLAAAGFVEYDTEAGLVRPTDRFERIEPRLVSILEIDPALEPVAVS